MTRVWETADWYVRLACALLVVIVVVALLSPAITPYDPAAQPDILRLSRLPPSLAHPFGTDQFSRDLFSRTLEGARVSLGIAVMSTTIAMLLGSAIGAIAGLGSQWMDTTIMRSVDASTAIPRLVLLIVILSLWGTLNPPMLVVVLGFTGWFQVSRLVRGEILTLKSQEFVRACHALGLSRRRLMIRHVLPHLTPQLIVATTLSIGNILLIEVGLSYLGLGVPAPGASWGTIIRDGQEVLGTAPWVALFPGLAIVVTVMAFSVLGDHLQHQLNPRYSESAAAE